MSFPRRVSKSRRFFLKTLPTALAASAAAAAPPSAQAQAPHNVPDIISADGLDVAQHIVAVDLPVAELESARPIVVRNRDNYAAIRRSGSAVRSRHRGVSKSWCNTGARHAARLTGRGDLRN